MFQTGHITPLALIQLYFCKTYLKSRKGILIATRFRNFMADRNFDFIDLKIEIFMVSEMKYLVLECTLDTKGLSDFIFQVSSYYNLYLL